jgi:hypothetical protein
MNGTAADAVSSGNSGTTLPAVYSGTYLLKEFGVQK